jgi:hypothetical protein
MEKICREFVYRRNINYPGMTRTLIVIDGVIARPTKIYRSKTRAHGVDIYCLTSNDWSKAWVIELVQSNTGKRHINFENVPAQIRELIERAWVYEGASVAELEKLLPKLYTLAK